jgi:glucose-6-phosphate isomerase
MQPHWARVRALATPRLDMREAFAADPGRFERLHAQAGPWLLDYSKHLVDDEILRALLALVAHSGVGEARAAMFAGAHINSTEERAVGHWALRQPASSPAFIDGRDVTADVQQVLGQMREFVGCVRDGRWRGFSDQPISDVVNIGIGGSDLGPQMVCEALRAYGDEGPRAHFVSNVDAADLHSKLAGLDPATTVFIVASKTFTTRETLANALSAKRWLLASADHDKAVARHFVAVSSNKAAVEAFGIDSANMFEFWDWVGGRYSLWSAIGLSIACYLGMDAFDELRAGAHEIDVHFRTAPPAANVPVVMAVLGIWYTRILGAQTHAVLPYDQGLHRLPAFLQQLDMESNGKGVKRDGRPVDGCTGPVVWGEPGTNAQHAFFQLLHQGTHLVPADFIVAANGHFDDAQHRVLLANCIAQSEALLRGKTAAQARQELLDAGNTLAQAQAQAPHRSFTGNRPNSTLLCERLDARALGALIALYEHKVFVQGMVFGVNSFDQWGVELGKQLAAAIESEISAGPGPHHDASTIGLINALRAMRQR